MTPAELEALMRERAAVGGAPNAVALGAPTAREQFEALERHRNAQRWQWLIGGAVALGSLYWLSTRLARVEGAVAEILSTPKEPNP